MFNSINKFLCTYIPSDKSQNFKVTICNKIMLIVIIVLLNILVSFTIEMWTKLYSKDKTSTFYGWYRWWDYVYVYPICCKSCVLEDILLKDKAYAPRRWYIICGPNTKHLCFKNGFLKRWSRSQKIQTLPMFLCIWVDARMQHWFQQWIIILRVDPHQNHTLERDT